MHPMLLALQQMVERQRASAPVDPHGLTASEKDAKILALQARQAELESICLYLANTIQSIRQAAEEPVISKTLLLALCDQLWTCATPAVGVVQPDTGTTTILRRAL